MRSYFGLARIYSLFIDLQPSGARAHVGRRGSRECKLRPESITSNWNNIRLTTSAFWAAVILEMLIDSEPDSVVRVGRIPSASYMALRSLHVRLVVRLLKTNYIQANIF